MSSNSGNSIVKGLGNGDVNAGAQKMYDLMNQLEANV